MGAGKQKLKTAMKIKVKKKRIKKKPRKMLGERSSKIKNEMSEEKIYESFRLVSSSLLSFIRFGLNVL